MQDDIAGPAPAADPPDRTAPRASRIQRRNRRIILGAALDVFAQHGFRGATLDQISERSGLSKPNILYYFSGKEEIHVTLLSQLMDNWLAPLRELNPAGEPLDELLRYVHRKLEMSREYPRESRLFANEMLQGAPRMGPALETTLKDLVDRSAAIIEGWIAAGRIAPVDPRHLIFSIWATTQHYADFDVQVRAVLGKGRGGEGRFEDAARYLEQLFLHGLTPKPKG
jgi:TetR/AcrR family transcriptional regulator